MLAAQGAKVELTDLEPDVLAALEATVARNALGERATVRRLDWDDGFKAPDVRAAGVVGTAFEERFVLNGIWVRLQHCQADFR